MQRIEQTSELFAARSGARANKGIQHHVPDLGTAIGPLYRIKGVPETYFVGKDGNLAGNSLGPIGNNSGYMTEAQFVQKLETLLAQKYRVCDALFATASHIVWQSEAGLRLASFCSTLPTPSTRFPSARTTPRRF